MTVDAYAQWDAAYVLGALSAVERTEFEEHLAGCARCQSAVAELAGMPGLLAQVPAGEVLAMDAADLGPEWREPVPPSLLATSAAGGWRRWLPPAAAAAAALVVGLAGGYAASSASHDGSPLPSPPAGVSSTSGPQSALPGRLAFSAVEPSSMTAVLDVVPMGSHTELRVECQYAVGSSTRGSDDYQGAWSEYSIWVLDRDGHATQLKSWTARPDRVMHPTASTSLTVAQIGSVEIRRVDTGHTVMRADLV